MQSNTTALRESANNSASLVIVTKALGFGKDNPAGSILNLMQRWFGTGDGSMQLLQCA
jgi:hypothetical protein